MRRHNQRHRQFVVSLRCQNRPEHSIHRLLPLLTVEASLRRLAIDSSEPGPTANGTSLLSAPLVVESTAHASIHGTLPRLLLDLACVASLLLFDSSNIATGATVSHRDVLLLLVPVIIVFHRIGRP